MRTSSYAPLLMIGALGAAAGAAFAAQPPNTVTSDAYFNTAMGTNALLNLPAPSGLFGIDNTAAGYAALQSNMSGSYNTAFGTSALTTAL